MGKIKAKENATLQSLIMNTGSLEELTNKKTKKTWKTLAKGLIKVAGKNKTLVKEERGVIDCCKIALNKDKVEIYESNPEFEIPKETLKDLSKLLLGFMRKNGQLNYIENQKWFKTGTYRVEIDVNFTPAREYGNINLGWHKDTGGDTIFVNLIFNNTKKIPGTEWTLDLLPFSKEKKKILLLNMPEKTIEKIEEVREILKKEKNRKIHGGILPPNGYVSWVDELIWHSSPYLANRSTFRDKETVFRMMGDGFGADTYEIMLRIAMTKETVLNKWCLKTIPEFSEEKFDFEIAREIYKKGYNKYSFAEELKRDLEKIDWSKVKMRTSLGISNDKDSDVLGSKKIGESTGMSGLERTNSKTGMLKKLKELMKGRENETRTFIRTWVRIVKKDKKIKGILIK